MSLSTKVLIFISVIFAISLAGFIVYKKIEDSRKIDEMAQSVIEQKKLVEGIVRSRSELVTRDQLEEKAKEQKLNLDAIKDDLEKLDAEIKALGTTIIISRQQHITNANSSHQTPRPDEIAPVDLTDPYGYLKNTQHYSLNEDFVSTKVPFGQVSFSAWKKEPWEIKIPERKYTVNTVIGISDDNKRHYSYSQIVIDTDGKRYPVPIESSNFIEEYPSAKFHWFNPHLFAGINGSVNLTSVPVKADFGPNLSVGLMSYGQYKNQPDLSVLQLGIGYNVVSQRPNLNLSPIQYNIGKHIPMISNTYIGPDISLDTRKDVSIGLGIRVGL